MKWLSSFRARLILTVFPTVAGITIATLVLAEWRFMGAYRGLFEVQFESQIEAFSTAKRKRSEALSAVLEKMARQPDVLAAMARRDASQLNQVLRPQLESLATQRLQVELPGGIFRAMGGGGHAESGGGPGGDFPRRDDHEPREGRSTSLSSEREDRGRPPSPLNRLVGRLLPSQEPYVDFITPEGELLAKPKKNGPGPGPPGGGRGLVPQLVTPPSGSAEFRRKSGRLSWLGGRKLEDVLKEQQVGYMRVEYGEEHKSEQVREVFITPIREPEGGKFLGAILFGLPLQVFAEKQLYEQSKRSEFGEIMGGVWVEDGLVSATIPKEQREEIASHIAQAMQLSGKSQREITMPVNGVRHQIFYRVLNPGSPFPQAAQVNFYSLAAMDHELAELRRDVGGLALLGLAIALLLVLWLSRSLSGPVRDLVVATQEIEQGNYDVRVPVRQQDEMGKLAASFNEMASGLALQDKYRSVLNAVADRTVAEQLIAQSGGLGLGGETRHVTMLFCDIRGFTSLTENMPPAEVIDLLNEHMTALTEVAYEHGGIVDKFVGDLIMVLFGAPLSTGADATRAVQCALSMLQVRRKLNATSRHSLEMGIGIATGPVVAGCMGSDQRLSYTVLGHRVNLASRLCSIAQAGEIVMDAETHEEARELMRAEPMQPMQLKGISEPVHPWRAVAGQE